MRVQFLGKFSYRKKERADVSIPVLARKRGNGGEGNLKRGEELCDEPMDFSQKAPRKCEEGRKKGTGKERQAFVHQINVHASGYIIKHRTGCRARKNASFLTSTSTPNERSPKG